MKFWIAMPFRSDSAGINFRSEFRIYFPFRFQTLNKAVISHFNFGDKMYESQDGMWKSSVIFPISNGEFYASFGNLNGASYVQLIVRGFYYQSTPVNSVQPRLVNLKSVNS